jgi:hypothetical protein
MNIPSTTSVTFDWDTPLGSDERLALFSHIAGNVVARGMETPVIWFLEIHRPLAPIGAQLGVALSPFIAVWLKDGAFDLQKYVQILRDPANIAQLIQLIEERSRSLNT